MSEQVNDNKDNIPEAEKTAPSETKPNESLAKVEEIISDTNAEKKNDTNDEVKPTEEKQPEVKDTDKTDVPSSEPIVDAPENPNDTSISDAETQSGDEHEPSDNIDSGVHDDAQPSNDNDIEIEPAIDLDNPQSKNQRYDK